MIENFEEKCKVGALLYCPALNNKVAESVISEKFNQPYSLALCLEDTVADDSVEIAEQRVKETIYRIYTEYSSGRKFYLPKIFIRVRNPEQLKRLYLSLKDYKEVLTGFIFPKYSTYNAEQYNENMREINKHSGKTLYMMPILESKDIVDYTHRHETLVTIKDYIDSMKDIVLNVRVGGNDFCNQFASRRHYDETIYDILPIAQLLSDILTVFSRDYVVSGPVWEFFASDNDEWKTGMENEIRLDKLNGFIGKTVIHPKQISVVNDALKMSRKDYEDAKEILGWDKSGLQVGKSFAGERMNEVKTHMNWAYKTMVLSEIYGVR